MVPSASSRLQATARRAPPPSCPAVSAPRVSQPTVLRPRLLRAAQVPGGGGRGSPASNLADRMRAHWPLPPEEPSRERGWLREATAAAAAARGPAPRARARAPARRSPNFPAARARRRRRAKAQSAAPLPWPARPPDLPPPPRGSSPPRLSPSSEGPRPARPSSTLACFLSPLLLPTLCLSSPQPALPAADSPRAACRCPCPQHLPPAPRSGTESPGGAAAIL